MEENYALLILKQEKARLIEALNEWGNNYKEQKKQRQKKLKQIESAINLIS